MEENAAKFQKSSLESINFSDYGYITDATLYAWDAAGMRFTVMALVCYNYCE